MNKSIFVIAALAVAGKPLPRRKFYVGAGRLSILAGEARQYVTAERAFTRITGEARFGTLATGYKALANYTFGVVELRTRFETVKVLNVADVDRATALAKLTEKDRKALGIKA